MNDLGFYLRINVHESSVKIESYLAICEWSENYLEGREKGLHLLASGTPSLGE